MSMELKARQSLCKAQEKKGKQQSDAFVRVEIPVRVPYVSLWRRALGINPGPLVPLHGETKESNVYSRLDHSSR